MDEPGSLLELPDLEALAVLIKGQAGRIVFITPDQRLLQFWNSG